ncbi:MAG: HAMP domain-containing histidine kinase, partial [Anaerolineales bacterium]|nr:HAMP domain-containing histidine kinase [Anaerolineales bacterium]
QAQWLVSLAPLPSQGWVMIIRDVTLLKRLDEARFQTLSEAAGRLQLPLAQAIGNMAELSSLVGDKDPRVAGLLFRQTNVWDRIQHWLYDMLQVMRIEAGVDLRPVEVDIAAALPDILHNAPDKGMRDRRVAVTWSAAPHLPRLRFDPSLLRQMVISLVRWAGRRNPADGAVRVSVAEVDGQVCLEVADDGPALTETDVARLFEIAVDLGDDGSGLELALVKSVADRMGAQVWARRQAQGGAIAIFMPVHPDGYRRPAETAA